MLKIINENIKYWSIFLSNYFNANNYQLTHFKLLTFTKSVDIFSSLKYKHYLEKKKLLPTYLDPVLMLFQGYATERLTTILPIFIWANLNHELKLALIVCTLCLQSIRTS